MLSIVLSFGALYTFIPIIIIIILIAAAAGLSRGWDLFTLFGFAVLTDFARGAGRGATGKGLNVSRYQAGSAAGARLRSRVPASIKGSKKAQIDKSVFEAGLGAYVGSKLGQRLSAGHQTRTARNIEAKAALGIPLTRREKKFAKTYNTLIEKPAITATEEEKLNWLKPPKGSFSTSRHTVLNAAALVDAGIIDKRREYRSWMKTYSAKRAASTSMAKALDTWGAFSQFHKVFHPKSNITISNRQKNKIEEFKKNNPNDTTVNDYLESLENKAQNKRVGVPKLEDLTHNEAKKLIKKIEQPYYGPGGGPSGPGTNAPPTPPQEEQEEKQKKEQEEKQQEEQEEEQEKEQEEKQEENTKEQEKEQEEKQEEAQAAEQKKEQEQADEQEKEQEEKPTP